MTRATGWRVPSVPTTGSGLPVAWLDETPAPPHATTRSATSSGGPTPASGTTPAPAANELAEFGRSEAMIRRWRGWSFSFRRRLGPAASLDPAAEPDEADPTDEADAADELDLVALADEEAWTELTLAALDAGDGDLDAWMSDGEADPVSLDPADGPWAMLAEELQDDETGFLAPHDDPTTTPELEDEFWARGIR